MDQRSHSSKSVRHKIYKNKNHSSTLLNKIKLKINYKESRRKSNFNEFAKNKEYMEQKINDFSNLITIQINNGIDLFDIKIPEKQLLYLDDVIKYILQKQIRLKNDVIVTRYYLSLFPTFLERLHLQPKKLETQEILYKIGIYMKYKEKRKNQVLFFNGQIGNLFYFILKGEVSVLIPSSYTCELTIQEYIDFFCFIIKFSDYELLKLIYESNKKIISNEFYKSIDDYDKHNEYLHGKSVPQIKEKELDVYNYMERFIFDYKKINNKDEEEKSNSSKNINSKIKKNNKKNLDNKKYLEKRNFILWKYVEVCKLHQGQCFGEIALEKDNCKRTATIITTKNSIFGTISKEEYKFFFKDAMERSRKNTIEGLLKCKLFQGYNYFSFESKFFNCFIFNKHKKGDYLFKQGENRDKFFYIRSGEIQIEINATFEQIDQIILSLGGNCKDKNFKNMLRNSQNYQYFFKKIRKFQIYIISGGDFLGTDEMVYFLENSSIYNLSAVCLTSCDLFELSMDFFDSMSKDKKFRENYKNLVESRKQRLIRRLYELKMNTILNHFNLLREDDNILNNRYNINENKSKNYIVKNKSKILNLSKLNWRKKEDVGKISLSEESKNYNDMNSNVLTKINVNQSFKNNKSRNIQNNLIDLYKTEKNIFKTENSNIFLRTIKTKNISDLNNIKINTISNDDRCKTINDNRFKLHLNKIKNHKSFSNLYNENSNLYKTKNLVTSVDKIIKKYTNNEIVGIRNVRVPKLLENNILIYNSIIDKLITKKNIDLKIKKCNVFDVLAFDNILVNEKIKREKHKSQNIPSKTKLNKLTIKRTNLFLK